MSRARGPPYYPNGSPRREIAKVYTAPSRFPRRTNFTSRGLRDL